jgi:outer membrane murein-binding lipoprotein Lpp
MTTQSRIQKIALVFLASLLLLTLTGCSSTYIDAFNPTIEQFNTAANEVSAQMDALVADNALFEDAAWQSDTSTALSSFKGAAEALKNLPAPEEEYVKLNTLVQELASQSMLAADAFNAAIDAQDITMMNEGSSYLTRVNELLPQINAEVDRLNQ